MNVYAGVYKSQGCRVLRVSDDLDGLSCETLADPGVLRFEYSERDMGTLAQEHNCMAIEINFGKENGGYRFLDLTAKTVTLSGDSEARGRNGWFVPREAYLFLNPRGDVVHIDIASSRPGKVGPIVLGLSTGDAKALAEAILAKCTVGEAAGPCEVDTQKGE